MALTSDENNLIGELAEKAVRRFAHDEKMDRYFEGRQRLDKLGIAVPPVLSRFEMVVNWPRVVVETVERRQDVKSLLRPGSVLSDSYLMELWRANNLDSDLALYNTDKMIFGRGFLCVGANPEDRDLPLITVESPREITVNVDKRTRRITAALRLYDVVDNLPRALTLYRPDYTLWAEFIRGVWTETGRDDHRLGRVPVVMGLNRRRTGEWWGTSEMADIIPLTDAAARTLTNLQVAAETHSVPQKWVLGMSKGDFVDQSGSPIPAWESYFGAIWANQKGPNEARVGQFTASDLKNFHETVNHYGQLASSVTGFPVKYFGQFTANPAAEGAIRADEAQMVKGIERKNSTTGSEIGWALGIAERIRTGAWPDANRISVEWHDPGTPTFSQRADALQKLAGGVPIVSRQGAWDELGWSEARKDREREYFEQESSDPYLGLLNAKDEAADGAVTEPAAGGGGVLEAPEA